MNHQFRGLGIGKSLALTSLTELLATAPEILIEARDTTVNIVRQLGGEVLGDAFDFYGMPVTPMRLTATRFRATPPNSGERDQRCAINRPDLA